MKITTNANDVVLRIEQLIAELQRKTNEFVKSVADIGRQAAAGAYGKAVSVTLEPIENGYKIAADGDAVVFLEFGAGTAVDIGDKYALVMPFEVSEGSWSRTEGSGEFARTGKWHFGGVEYTYILPRNGMQKAYEAIIQSIESEARRIFR